MLASLLCPDCNTQTWDCPTCSKQVCNCRGSYYTTGKGKDIKYHWLRLHW